MLILMTSEHVIINIVLSTTGYSRVELCKISNIYKTVVQERVDKHSNAWLVAISCHTNTPFYALSSEMIWRGLWRAEHWATWKCVSLELSRKQMVQNPNLNTSSITLCCMPSRSLAFYWKKMAFSSSVGKSVQSFCWFVNSGFYATRVRFSCFHVF